MIYLDNAATTKPIPAAIEAAKRAMETDWFNPSAIYSPAIEVKRQIEEVRNLIAKEINAEPEEIIFTSGASESNMMALKGNAALTTKIEHPSINNMVVHDRIRVDKKGKLISESIKEDYWYAFASMFSIQHANNEIGTIQDVESCIKEIKQNCHDNILVHVDATQTFGVIPIDVKKMKIDMLSASAHKIGGIKGTGFLYANERAKNYINCAIHGEQENGIRGGTYNVSGILAMGEAVKAINYDKSEMIKLRDWFIVKLLTQIEDTYLVGHPTDRLPNNINVCFRGVLADALVAMLSEHEIYVSPGSACSAADAKPSHVLKAIGLPTEDLKSCVRFSLGPDTTKEELEYVIEVIKNVIKILRG